MATIMVAFVNIKFVNISLSLMDSGFTLPLLSPLSPYSPSYSLSLLLFDSTPLNQFQKEIFPGDQKPNPKSCFPDFKKNDEIFITFLISQIDIINN